MNDLWRMFTSMFFVLFLLNTLNCLIHIHLCARSVISIMYFNIFVLFFLLFQYYLMRCFCLQIVSIRLLWLGITFTVNHCLCNSHINSDIYQVFQRKLVVYSLSMVQLIRILAISACYFRNLFWEYQLFFQIHSGAV